MADHVRTYVGASLMGAALCVALVRSGGKTSARRGVSVEQAHQMYAEAAEKEPGERLQAGGEFRGFPWSQDDDFHNKESKRVKEYAKSHHVAVQSVLAALDDGMRSRWETPSGIVPTPKVMPCRPRLTY